MQNKTNAKKEEKKHFISC